MEKIKNFFASDKFKKPLFTVVVSILLSFIVITIIGIFNGTSPLTLLSTMLLTPIENMRRIGDVLAQVSWLIPVSLSFAIAYKAGLFNIGMSGQMLFAGMIGVFLGVQGTPWILILIIMLLMGAIVGALSGFLKSQYKIHEVVSTIMLNWAIYYIYKFMYKPGRSFVSSINQDSKPIVDSSIIRVDFLSNIFKGKFSGSTISLAIFFAIIAIVVVYVIMNKTKLGYEIKATGHSEQAARNAGISTKLKIIKAMALAGALSGLAGFALYLGGSQLLPAQSTVPSQGFDGIAVALIAGGSPIGIGITSIFYAIISQSAHDFATFGLDGNLIVIINGILILGVAISPSLFKKYREKQFEKLNSKAGGK